MLTLFPLHGSLAQDFEILNTIYSNNNQKLSE